MKKYYLFFFFSLFHGLVRGQFLYQEDFGTNSWPIGWILLDENNGSSSTNWVVTNSQDGAHAGNDTPPAAVFEWAVGPSWSALTNYEQSMTSPSIDVGDNEAVLIKFYFALDFYDQGELNGLRISYNGGSGWQDVLSYAIGPGLTIQNNPWSSEESFIAEITGGSDLQLKWTAYGANSWAIDCWIVDNIKILALPKLTEVKIESSNEDPTTAIEGTEISLNITADTDIGDPYIQINGNVCTVSPLSGASYLANYTVQNMDPDGPLQFTIDYTSTTGIDGRTVKQTTDNSFVIVDNSDPPPFQVGSATGNGGNVAIDIWNSTNTDVQLEVNVPQDSAVASFNYYNGNSLMFDGINDEVTITGQATYQVSNALTIESWVKPGVAPVDYDGFLSYAMNTGGVQAGFGFAFYLTGWRFFLKTTSPGQEINYSAMAETQLPVGQWTHIAATFDGQEIKLYRNGALMDSADAMGNVEWSGAPAEMVLGNFPKEGASHFFNGQIDEVRLWNIVRTKDQLKASREINLTGDENGLVGYWQIDEGSGNITGDSTDAMNDASISGATWIIQDSPIEFKTPIYDTGVIVGSAYQLRSRVGTNDFQTFGQKDTITAADFNAGVKTVTAPKDAFQAINGFLHGETAQFSALLFDASGNFSEGDTSTTNMVIDLIANDPDPVSISSNNQFSNLAKTGDNITITMTYDEDVNLPTITVDGNPSDESDLGGEQFSATYTFVGSETEGIVNYISANVTDYLGNPGIYTGGSIGSGSLRVRYDKTLPELQTVSILSNNADNQWAKVGDEVTISITASEALIKDSTSIVDKPATNTNSSTTQFSSKYTLESGDPEGVVAFQITFTDSAGNEGLNVLETTNNSSVIFDSTPPESFTLGSVIAVGGNIVEKAWNSTNTGLNIMVPISVTDTTLKNGVIQIWAKVGANLFSSIGDPYTIINSDLGSEKLLSLAAVEVEALTGFSEEDSLYFKAQITDRPGNQTDGIISQDRLVIDQVLPVIRSVSYASNFSDSTLSTVGSLISVTFSTEPLSAVPTIIISGNSGSVAGSVGDSIWIGTYNMQDGDSEGVIPFTINGLIDLRGNPMDNFSSTTDETAVVFDNTKPSLNPVTISSSNPNSTNWAKIGDTINVNFSANELLSNQSVTISGQNSSIIDLGNNQYTGYYVMTDSESEGVISFEIIVTDSVGLISDPVFTTSNSSEVIFDMTPPLLDLVHIESNNANNALIGVANDEVYLSFSANEPLNSDSIDVTILGEPVVAIFSEDTYKCTITLDGTEPSGILTYTIDFVDRAGNSGIQVNSTTDDSYVNHDTGPPEVAFTGIYSSNTDSSWAKLGDTVFVRFAANEPLNSCEIKIAGNSTIQSSQSSTVHLGYVIMSDAYNEECMTFNVTYSDLGGLTGPNADSTTNNSRVCFDKTAPVISRVSNISNNIYSDSLAKIGDTDTIKFTISEVYRSLDVTLSDMIKVPVQSDLDFIATHTFDGSENNGVVPFNLFMIDSAGNQSTMINTTDDGSQVRFDSEIPYASEVYFYSNNSNDTSLCIPGDTIYVNFIPSEVLRPDLVIEIAGTQSVGITEVANSYLAKYEMTGVETEGYLPYSIVFQDQAGNSGISIDTTHGTNSSYVLFDQSPPEDFTVDTVLVRNGIIEKGYWNASNDSITILVPIVEGDQSLINGKCQLLYSVNGGLFSDAGLEIEINTTGIISLTLGKDQFTSLVGYADGANFQFSATILDRAGNLTSGNAHSTIIHIDQTLPLLSNITFESDNEFQNQWAKPGDKGTLSFESSEGLKIANANIILDTLSFTTSDLGVNWTLERDFTVYDVEGVQSFSIFYRDSAGNFGNIINSTSNGSVITLDKTRPVVSNLREGSDSLDLDYSNKSDSLWIYWSQSDALSGIRGGFVGLSSDSISTDIINWISSNGEDKKSLGNLELQNDNIYFSSVFVEDSVGNHSDTIWSDGIYIDIVKPDTGHILDGQWIMDADYTPDSTELKYNWSGFSDNTEIDFFELAIGTGNDTTNILDWFKTDSTDSITIRNLNLIRDTLYFTYIRATDIAKNISFIPRTDGVYFDNTEPFIKSFTPNVNDSAEFLSVLRGDTISIKFNRPIYSYKVAVSSKVDTQFSINQSYSDSVITILWDDTLASYDTVTVFVDSAFAINTLFVSETLQFFSHLWGDLNKDYEINVADILEFNSNWPNNDLGPFTGKPPHVKPTPDNNADFQDLKAFSKMWHWRYHKLSFNSDRIQARTNIDNNFALRGRRLIFNLKDASVKLGEILIGETNHPFTDFQIINLKPTTFMFSSEDTSSQIKSFSFADKNGLNDEITLLLPETKEKYFKGKIQYQFWGDHSQDFIFGSEIISEKLLPQKFMLHKIYPNPFNAKTNIKFDLPEKGFVSIKVHDLLGRTIKLIDQSSKDPGSYSYTWDGKDNLFRAVSSGIYFVQVQAADESRIQKILLLK